MANGQAAFGRVLARQGLQPLRLRDVSLDSCVLAPFFLEHLVSECRR